MVLEMIRLVRLIRWSRSSAEAKSLKTRAKGLSDYHSSEAVVEAAIRGANGPNKRATIMTDLLKKGELKSSSLLD
jgi:hypothetical protein